MKLSIIIVSFNAIKTIEETLISISSQTCPNIEKVIVDGNSNDGSQDIIKKYLKPCDKFISEKDKGIYDAMNKGIAMASGEVVYFLNADDVFADVNVVADIMNAFVLNPSWILVYGRILYKKLPDNVITSTASFQINSTMELVRNFISHQAIFVQKRMFEDCGKFDTTFKLCADRDWIIKVYFKYPSSFKYIDRLIANCIYEGFTFKNQKSLVQENLLVTFKRFPLPYALFYFVRYFLIREFRNWFNDIFLIMMKKESK